MIGTVHSILRADRDCSFNSRLADRDCSLNSWLIGTVHSGLIGTVHSIQG